ncbi:SHOCT domain-containing protein [Embleya sp. NPDC127516]|uniref:SHOCT domain-containing protein n=1 Tax=Embleya sp. NPDC127516 TaxID=3363990 RepID=UPI0037FC7FC0
MDWGDLADIALDRLGGANSMTRDIAETAVPGEVPLLVTSARARQEWTNGTLVLTTRRLVYTKEGRPTVAVPLAGIAEVEVGRSRLTGNIVKVTAVGGDHAWENVAEVATFAARLRDAVAAAASAERALDRAGTPGRPQEEPLLLDRIERLVVLHRHGALTDEEFARAKRRLLGG